MGSDRPTPAELFNAALESHSRGDLDDGVAWLREAFFSNVHIAPALLGVESLPPAMWCPDADGDPRSAAEYLRRYAPRWDGQPGALRLVEDVWNDTVVRGELRSFVNVSKAILNTTSEAQRADLIREWERFADPRRIRGTQGEIVARMRERRRRHPPAPARVVLILLAARDPAASVEFYRRLLRVEPVETSRLAGGYAEFDLPGVRIAIHGHDRLGAGDPYRLGEPPASLGWGAIFVLHVAEFDRYHENAVEAGLPLLDSDLERPGQRFFLVKDPSGYLIEVSEEPEPFGL